MSLAIWGATPYCHAKVEQLWSSLSKTRGVASPWRYGVCLSRAEGHPVVTDLRFPPHPVPPNKRIPKKGDRSHFSGSPFRSLFVNFFLMFLAGWLRNRNREPEPSEPFLPKPTGRQQSRCTMKDDTLPETGLPMGQAPPQGAASQASAASSQASAQGFSGLQKGTTTLT